MTTYLDHAATTAVRPEAVEAMLPLLTGPPGNPSGAHGAARAARAALDDAREAVAALLGGEPGEVVFTSGGTEADALAVGGSVDRRGGRPVCTAVEHHAVLDPVEAAGGVVVPVDEAGVVSAEALAAHLAGLPASGEAPAVVSVQLANNETGLVQPLAAVAAVVAEVAPGTPLHTDAVQAVPWLDVAGLAQPAALVSASAHKFGGPAGVGALLVRPGAEPAALLRGGGQERGLRSGTPNVAGIAGMGAAARAVVAEREGAAARVAALRDRLESGLRATVPDLVTTLPPGAPRLPSHCHVCVPGVDSESLLLLLDRAGLCASAASSCAAGALEPSHVLAAMGVAPDRAAGALRLSLGWSSTDADVDHALAVIPPAVERLRRYS